MGRFIIYGLADPGTGVVRYVGRSSSGLRRANGHATPIICLNDGKTFTSAQEASFHYGLGKGDAARVANGTRKHVKGLRFKYQKVQGDQ